MPNSIASGRKATRMRQYGGLVALAVGAVLAFTGCSSSSTGASGPSTTSVAIGSNADPAAFGYDPASLSGGGVATFWQALYSSLVTTTADGSVKPGLATSYKFSENKSVLTLKLRSGVTFADGSTLTAKLVKANLDRRSNPALGAYGMFGKGSAAEIKDVAAPDPSTVMITFAHPTASALTMLADSAGRIVGQKGIDDPKSLATAPDGSGPYTLSASGTTQGNTYTLQKNTRSWDASSYPYEAVVYKIYQDTQTEANALASGQVQVAQLDGATSQIATSSGKKVTAVAGNVYALPVFDTTGKTSKPFANVKVRQALSMAIDRDSIAKLHPGATPTASFFPKGTAGNDSSLDDAYAYNPTKAKQLMAEAGYPNGFAFKIVTIGPTLDADLQALQSDWKGIGVSLTIQHATSYAQGLQAQTTTPLGYNSFAIGKDPLGFTLGFVLGGTFNPQQNTNRAIQSALSAAESGDGNADTASLKNLNAAIVNEGWAITLYEQAGVIGYDPAKVRTPQTPGTTLFPLLSSIKPAT